MKVTVPGMHAVLVATFFNLLFLMLTLRVVCTRLWWRRQTQENSRAEAQCPECPDLQRVTPVVIVHPDSEVISSSSPSSLDENVAGALHPAGLGPLRSSAQVVASGLVRALYEQSSSDLRKVLV